MCEIAKREKIEEDISVTTRRYILSEKNSTRSVRIRDIEERETDTHRIEIDRDKGLEGNSWRPTRERERERERERNVTSQSCREPDKSQ